MILHTFAFRWKPETSEALKQRALDEIRNLHTRISGILETHAGFNFSPRSQGYEFGGVMKFSDRSALDAYSVHPVHLELLSWLVPLIDAIEVDFET
ncbi:Dabb family protein [Granulicella sp. S190]|uniref:Dabb family protein n=1 Tax=Granulicella sp. S190 TaxID=1747226 RepID=UPI00131D7C0F|nr:Dabb family protein [Granulicella sp. S190]